MYTETNKGFTVITNFGCDQGCRYCISKAHPLLQGKITPPEGLDWENLEKYISLTEAPNINLSGGGDPFYQWENKIDFYTRMFSLSNQYNKGLDIHTRILPENYELLGKFRKIALALEYWDKKGFENLRLRIKDLEEVTQFRVIQVVGPRLNSDTLSRYIEDLLEIGVKQITLREMFGNKGAHENFKKLKNELDNIYPGVLFLPDGEYHEYYFISDNKVYPYFFGMTKEDRELWRKRYEDLEQSCN